MKRKGHLKERGRERKKGNVVGTEKLTNLERQWQGNRR